MYLRPISDKWSYRQASCDILTHILKNSPFIIFKFNYKVFNPFKAFDKYLYERYTIEPFYRFI